MTVNMRQSKYKATYTYFNVTPHAVNKKEDHKTFQGAGPDCLTSAGGTVPYSSWLLNRQVMFPDSSKPWLTASQSPPDGWVLSMLWCVMEAGDVPRSNVVDASVAAR